MVRILGGNETTLDKCIRALHSSDSLLKFPTVRESINFIFCQFPEQQHREFTNSKFDIFWKWKMQRDIVEICADGYLEITLRRMLENGMMATCIFLLQEARSRLRAETFQNLLHELASQQKEVNMLKLLISNGANIQSVSEDIFQYACHDADLDRLQFLIEFGCFVSTDLIVSERQVAKESGFKKLEIFLDSLARIHS